MSPTAAQAHALPHAAVLRVTSKLLIPKTDINAKLTGRHIGGDSGSSACLDRRRR